MAAELPCRTRRGRGGGWGGAQATTELELSSRTAHPSAPNSSRPRAGTKKAPRYSVIPV